MGRHTIKEGLLHLVHQHEASQLELLQMITRRSRTVTGKAVVTAMPTLILTRKKKPFDGVSPEVFADLAAFVRRVAPRWVDGTRSLNRITLRRANQRELAHSRRRGYPT